MSLSKNKNKKESAEKNNISSRVKKDDMMDFIDRELKMFNKQSNFAKEPNDNLNIINNSSINNNKNINPSLNYNPKNPNNNVNLGLSLKMNLNQPIMPNSQISNFKLKS